MFESTPEKIEEIFKSIQSDTDPIPTINQNPFLPRYLDDLSDDELNKMLKRFSSYSEEQCLEIGGSIMIISASMEQHPGITGV